ncbi:hypothetical protein GCM10009641_32150 [Mycobacterium cookii]
MRYLARKAAGSARMSGAKASRSTSMITAVRSLAAMGGMEGTLGPSAGARVAYDRGVRGG